MSNEPTQPVSQNPEPEPSSTSPTQQSQPTQPAPTGPSASDKAGSFFGKLGAWLGVLVLLGIVGLFLAALIPRWWAQQLGDLIDGRITYGSAVGVIVGLVFTLLPLMVLMGSWRWRKNTGVSVFFLIMAMVLALPNLMTLWIAVGTSGSAHAGQRILDVNGPGFRGGSLIGAGLGALIFLFVWYLAASRSRAKKQAQEARAALETRQ